MSDDITLFQAMAWFAGLFVFCVIVFMLVSVPFLYLEGQAKSTWFAETRGIEMPWYYAMTLDVNIGSADAEVDLDTTRRRGR